MSSTTSFLDGLACNAGSAHPNEVTGDDRSPFTLLGPCTMSPILALISVLFGGDNANAQEAAPQPEPAAIVVSYQPEQTAQPEPVVQNESQRWLGVVELPGQKLNIATTMVTDQVSFPFLLNRVYNRFEPGESGYKCEVTLTRGTVCTTEKK